jgi:hypothetical protein
MPAATCSPVLSQMRVSCDCGRSIVIRKFRNLVIIPILKFGAADVVIQVWPRACQWGQFCWEATLAWIITCQTRQTPPALAQPVRFWQAEQRGGVRVMCDGWAGAHLKMSWVPRFTE